MALSPDYSIRHAFDFEDKERLVFEVADGVTTLEEGRELVSRPQGSWPLAPTTRFAVPLTLSEQWKVGIQGS